MYDEAAIQKDKQWRIELFVASSYLRARCGLQTNFFTKRRRRKIATMA